ncbi:hypothetical protein GLYMA_10G286666v4 [Glycine max]|nr:hypothetical protein GLYMA_10G286666v4 [Glycine max]
MKAIGVGLTLLQSLDVTLCTRLTDMGLSVVAKGCCDLRILRMAACKFVTDGVLVALSKNCHDLEELRLELTSITDDGLISLASGCHHIKILNLYLCQRNLEALGVRCCEELTDVAFQLKSNVEPGLSLQMLDISYCEKISVGYMHSCE